MKKIIFILLASFISATLSAQPPDVPADKGAKFGIEFSATDSVLDVNYLAANLKSTDSLAIKVHGKVNSVCAKEGCWLKLESKDGAKMVKMKDHSFLVPTAINGKEIVVNGTAYKKTTSVKELRHYAEDAGKSKEEIEKIKEPKTEIIIQATGIEVL